MLDVFTDERKRCRGYEFFPLGQSETVVGIKRWSDSTVYSSGRCHGTCLPHASLFHLSSTNLLLKSRLTILLYVLAFDPFHCPTCVSGALFFWSHLLQRARSGGRSSPPVFFSYVWMI
ncbi:hypothetical protein KC19_2G020300 [Ceratodon purpureus]|uniref:Uncharacterized protein n=1 Tax=Ceratodon purpureus TaxID=3225 RepID=A0A8T0IP67_CERPU|nr:hypothetical protein KC19_2G020300 [Ceratodon purpureus]